MVVVKGQLVPVCSQKKMAACVASGQNRRGETGSLMQRHINLSRISGPGPWWISKISADTEGAVCIDVSCLSTKKALAHKHPLTWGKTSLSNQETYYLLLTNTQSSTRGEQTVGLVGGLPAATAEFVL